MWSPARAGRPPRWRLRWASTTPCFAPGAPVWTGRAGIGAAFAGGYAHGPKMVQRWTAENRTRPAPRTARKWLTGTSATTALGTSDVPSDPNPALLSPRQLTWLLVRLAETLPHVDAAVARWVEQDTETALVASLARRFTALVRGCGTTQTTRATAPVTELETWLAAKRRPVAPAPSRHSPLAWKQMAPRCVPL